MKNYRVKLRILIPCLLAGWLMLSGCGEDTPVADLVLLDGKIVTMDDTNPEAEALAIKDGKIIAVGNSASMQAFIGDETEQISLGGQLAVPGFADGHAHAMGLGYAKMNLDLTQVTSWDDLVAMVKDAAEKAAPGEWILGRGWHHEKLGQPSGPTTQGYPSHHALSAVSPENPVMLDHASGHSICVNAKAMELGGVTRETADPPGGEIIRDKNGDAIGIFLENAEKFIADAKKAADAQRSPEQIKAEKIRAIQLAEEECLAKGITSFHDAGSSFETIDLFNELAAENQLRVRFWIMIIDSLHLMREKSKDYRVIDAGNGHLTVRAIKQYVDGALGSHGAWLLAPYSDQPQTSGLNTTSLEDLSAVAEIALENDLQLCTHAIGDRGNREMLDIYQQAFAGAEGEKDLRWRIEHAQHLDPADISRFQESGIIASMQGVHCTSDGPWVPKRIGETRAEAGAYVWRKLIESGATIVNGTDAPVEDVDPLENFYSTVTRMMSNGEQFYPGQVMSREEALRSTTLNAAYAAFQEKEKGSLAVGKLADITVLSKDIMTIPAEEILNTEVVYTIVDGEIRYQKM